MPFISQPPVSRLNVGYTGGPASAPMPVARMGPPAQTPVPNQVALGGGPQSTPAPTSLEAQARGRGRRGGGGGGGRSATPPAGTATATAAPDNSLQAALDKLNAATDRQQADVNKPLTAQTEDMVNASNLDIGSQTAGLQQGQADLMSRRGLGASGSLAAQMAQGVSEAGQRESAKAATGIRLGQAQRQDDLNLARQGLANNLLTAGVNASAMPAQLALQQMGFGLQQQGLQGQLQNMSLQAQLERERMRQQQDQFRADLALREQQLINSRSGVVPNSGYRPPSSPYVTRQRTAW